MSSQPTTTVKVNLGFTANLGNFQSLRVDVGLEDFVRSGEHVDDAVERVYNYVEAKLVEKLEQTKKELDNG